MIRFVALIAVCFALMGAPAFAQGKRVALVIGVSAYEKAPALPNPINDAVDMAAALQQAGFQITAAYDPTYADMQKALRDFGRALDGADTGLVFYAGHGLQVDGKNYLLPRDVTLGDDGSVERESVNMNAILELLGSEPRVSVVLLDACRDNPLAANLARRAGAARRAAVNQGLAQVPATAANTLIAYSTQPGATAGDGTGRNSPFTAGILRHITAPGLDVQELMRRVRASVIAETGGVQVPWDSSSLTQTITFIPAPGGGGPPPASAWVAPRLDPTPQQLDVALWNDVKGKSTGEIETYLRRYPNGIFADTARAQIAALQQAATQRRSDARQMAADIAKEFAALAGRGAIVDSPKEPHEFYANARTYELQGDFLNTRRAYLGFFKFGLPYVDPHYRFQSFLKVQEGRAGAREVYSELASARSGDETLAYAAALLLETEARKAKLDEIIRAKPDFAPAYFELARNYSLAQLGSQTNADREREAGLLEKFVALHEQGKLVRWFIDQAVVAQQLDDARQKLVSFKSTAGQRQFTMSTSAGNEDWTFVFTVAEAVEEVFVQLPGQPRQSLGFLPQTDSRTGKPQAKLHYSLPNTVGAMTITASYRDGAGQMRGPYQFPFDPKIELAKSFKAMAELSQLNWLRLQGSDGRKLLYFTGVSTYRCAIREIKYGLNTMVPDRVHPLGPCDPSRPMESRDTDKLYMDVPLNTAFASAQVTYTDGTRSGVIRYDLR
jgi:uncharacterized caspase-like protein